jgi:hypothetical protein
LRAAPGLGPRRRPLGEVTLPGPRLSVALDAFGPQVIFVLFVLGAVGMNGIEEHLIAKHNPKVEEAL